MNAEVFVGPGGFKTIQEGVDAIEAEGTVRVASGIYKEDVTILGKTINIEGAQYGVPATKRLLSQENETVLNGNFLMESNKTTIDGFTIINEDNPGIYTSPDFSGYKIQNNIIKTNTLGIYANSSKKYLSQIKQNVIINMTKERLVNSNGIFSNQGISNLIIRKNLFFGHEYSINLGSAVLDINIYIAKNFIDSSIVLTNTADLLIKQNYIFGSPSSSLFFGGGTSMTVIEGNEFKENKIGIRITSNLVTAANRDIRIINNNFKGNKEGIVIGLDSYKGILSAVSNYWNSIDGPSGIGKGSGDSIIDNDFTTTILFTPFLTKSLG